jgi:hypothetical protein
VSAASTSCRRNSAWPSKTRRSMSQNDLWNVNKLWHLRGQGRGWWYRVDGIVEFGVHHAQQRVAVCKQLTMPHANEWYFWRATKPEELKINDLCVTYGICCEWRGWWNQGRDRIDT